MKRIILGLTVSLLAAGSTDAALLSRAGGQAYYDTALDITWLADANYARTSGYDSDGFMTWNDSQAWIGSLNAEAGGVGHLGANNWRLPLTVQPDASCGNQYDPGSPYSIQSYGSGCTGSEMGHLFNVDGIKTNTPGVFANVQRCYYWSATSYAPDTDFAWDFCFKLGKQDVNFKGNLDHAWAVRSGDIGTVPVPGAVWLFGSGLAALGAKLKRRAKATEPGA